MNGCEQALSRIGTRIVFCTFAVALVALAANAQLAPTAPERPWNHVSTPPLERLRGKLTKEFQLSPTETYTLAQLIDLAEQHNPETREAWEAAKVQVGLLGIAKSDLYPTLVATAMGQTTQTGVLINDAFVKQILGLAQGQAGLNYTIFDFGARLDRVAKARANLLSANFGFNDTHRRIIFQVMMFYYQLLNANGQRKAAETDLENAKAVQQAAEARLLHGLATLPDVLETRSATAQAEYDLQQTIGSEEIASGDLATTLMASPESRIHVEGIETLPVPDELTASVSDLIKRALNQRPDLQARLAEIETANASIREARSAYYPVLAFEGTYGYLRAYGEQPPFNGTYAGSPVYNAQLSLSWTVFDGGRRRNNLAEAKADEKQAEARAEETQDQIADEVWRSYSDTKTALRQRQAAGTLLNASTISYNAALESYKYGVRNILDVLSAQRALAQARSADITARARVLTSFADLGYRTGDLLEQQAAKRKP
ncbi:MAG TPA: TolC family protein [Bryobacteraceae bacterium]|nr:TolC family protein [Bryobacteraceae bacterium]